jgi:hypothetical protein
MAYSHGGILDKYPTVRENLQIKEDGIQGGKVLKDYKLTEHSRQVTCVETA